MLVKQMLRFANIFFRNVLLLNYHCDVLVIGGGISGVIAAKIAAKNNLDTIQKDFTSETCNEKETLSIIKKTYEKKKFGSNYYYSR